MIRILYHHRNYGEWECIGSYGDLRQATSDLEKYKRGTLGETGELKLVTNEKEFAYLMFFGTDEEMEGMIVDYTLAKECKNEEVWYICYKCGKCGRVFENGFMVDDGGTTIEEEQE